jgi:hypothetical protein
VTAGARFIGSWQSGSAAATAHADAAAGEQQDDDDDEQDRDHGNSLSSAIGMTAEQRACPRAVEVNPDGLARSARG